MFSFDQLKITGSLSVSDLTRYLRQMLESDEILQNIWVQGEISNMGRPASGHIYFTLKDSGASLRCVIWRSNAIKISTPLMDGIAIEAHGNITVYEAGGQYQLIIDGIRSKGEGYLYQEFLRLKKILEEEGIFNTDRKRAIPKFIRRIGIITSPTGAALQDILNTLERRNPLLEVIIFPSAVQGLEASDELVNALRCMNRIKPDVILLARGGGSIEDLWAFNDEKVVREIVVSDVPVISGIGHETDFTLADFAADLRAPTPTAAAELASQITILDLKESIHDLKEDLLMSVGQFINEQTRIVQQVQSRLRYCSPSRRILNEWQNMDMLSRRMVESCRHLISIEKTRLTGLEAQLLSLNPENVIKRGFAVVTRKLDDKLVTRTEQAVFGDELNIRVQNGTLPVLVTTREAE